MLPCSSSPRILLSKQEVSLFEKFPTEIRNQIYSYLLSFRYTEIEHYAKLDAHMRPIHLQTFRFHPAILQTNKFINKEASSFLYAENLFISVSFAEDIAWRLPSTIRGFPTLHNVSISRFHYAALHCSFITTSDLKREGDPFEQSYDSINVIMVADDFGKFVRDKRHLRLYGIAIDDAIDDAIGVGLSINPSLKNFIDFSKIVAVSLTLRCLELARAERPEIANLAKKYMWKYVSSCIRPGLFIWGNELHNVYRNLSRLYQHDVSRAQTCITQGS